MMHEHALLYCIDLLRNKNIKIHSIIYKYCTKSINTYFHCGPRWNADMGADKQECHVLQYVRNVCELVAAMHHRLRSIVSRVKMSCNISTVMYS